MDEVHIQSAVAGSITKTAPAEDKHDDLTHDSSTATVVGGTPPATSVCNAGGLEATGVDWSRRRARPCNPTEEHPQRMPQRRSLVTVSCPSSHFAFPPAPISCCGRGWGTRCTVLLTSQAFPRAPYPLESPSTSWPSSQRWKGNSKHYARCCTLAPSLTHCRDHDRAAPRWWWSATPKGWPLRMRLTALPRSAACRHSRAVYKRGINTDQRRQGW